MMKFKLFISALLILQIFLAACCIMVPKADASPDIIYSDAAYDGFVEYDSYTPDWDFSADSTYLQVGDWSENQTWRSFVKFDISGISRPLISARLYLYLDYTTVDGTGYTNSPLMNPGLGDLNVIHIWYGDLDEGAYSQPSVGNDPGTLIASGVNPDPGYVSIDVTAAVEDDINDAETYSSFMIRCAVDTDDDNQADFWTFLSADKAGTDKDPYIEYYTTGPRPSINSQWTNSPPSIDGVVGSGEWSNLQITFQSPEYPDSYVLPTYVYFMNDNTNLYVMVDAVGDTTDNEYDECLLTFNYQDSPPYFQHYAELIGTSTSWTEGGTIASYDGAVGFNGHKVYEFSIPLNAINAQPGQPIDFCSPAYGIKGASIPYDSDGPKDNVWPQGLDVSNLNSWGILNLRGRPYFRTSNDPVGGVIMPVSKLTIISPYLTLVGIVATLSSVYAFERRRKT